MAELLLMNTSAVCANLEIIQMQFIMPGVHLHFCCEIIECADYVGSTLSLTLWTARSLTTPFSTMITLFVYCDVIRLY